MSTFERQPKIVGGEGEDALLRCPTCGGDYVAQGEVVVRQREREDGPGMVVAVRGCEVSVRHIEIDPVQGRRDSIDIVFACEAGCPSKVLQLQEHKGQTVVAWLERSSQD